MVERTTLTQVFKGNCMRRTFRGPLQKFTGQGACFCSGLFPLGESVLAIRTSSIGIPLAMTWLER